MTSWQTLCRQAVLYRQADRYAKGVVSSLMLLTLAVLLFYPMKEVSVPVAKLAQVRITLIERPMEVVAPPKVVETPKVEELLAKESEVTVPIPEPEPVVEKVAPLPEPVMPPPPPPKPEPVVEVKPEPKIVPQPQPKPVVKPKIVKPVAKPVETPVEKTPTTVESTTAASVAGETADGGTLVAAPAERQAGVSAGAKSGSAVTSANESVELAKLVAIVEANKVYPRRARQNNEEGRLSIAVSLDASGRVTGVTLRDTHPSRLLQQAALKAAASLVGVATQLGGPREVVIPIRFQLSDPN